MTKQSLSLLKPAARYLRHNHASVFYRLEDLYRWGQDLARFRYPLEDFDGSMLDYAHAEGLPHEVLAPATTLDRPPSRGIVEDMDLIGQEWKNMVNEGNNARMYMQQLRSYLRHPISAVYKVELGPAFVSAWGDVVVGGKTPLRLRRYSQLRHSEGIEKAEAVEGPVVSLLSTFASSFSHWILDSMMKLLYIPKEERANYRYLVPKLKRGFINRYLESLGVEESQLVYVENWVQCEQLLYIESSMKANSPHPDALRRLRSEFDVPIFGPGDKRIFIGRRQRCLENEDEIVSIAANHGVERHFLEDLNIREQVALFSQAEFITGYHGAGFVNMLYAPKETRILEIINPAKWDHGYIRTAALLGFEHWHVCTDYKPGVWDSRMDPKKWEKTLDLIFGNGGSCEDNY